MVSFHPLNIHDQDSIARILLVVDIAIQYGEDEEPKEPKYADDEDAEEEDRHQYAGERVVEETWRDLLEQDWINRE